MAVKTTDKNGIIRNGGGYSRNDSEVRRRAKRPSTKILCLSLVALLALGSAIFVLAADILPFASGQPAQAPNILHHPDNSAYSKSAPARLYVQADAADGGYLTYEWRRSGPFDQPLDKNADAETIRANSDTFSPGNQADPSLKADGTKTVLDFTTPEVAGTKYYYYWVEVTNHYDSNGDGDTDDIGEIASRYSGFAEVRVVNRKLFTSLQLGNMEGSIEGKTSGNIGVKAITEYTGWKKVNGEWRWNTTAWERGNTIGSESNIGKAFDPQPHATWGSPVLPASVTNPNTGAVESFGAYSAELCPFGTGSMYQEIATVPGKIYEWSFFHAKRANDSDTDRFALIIGPAINSESEYGMYDPTEHNYWNRYKDAANAEHSKTPIQNQGDYNYGIAYGSKANARDNTYFNAVLSKLKEDKSLTGDFTSADYGQSYAVDYAGKQFYVYLGQTTYNIGGRHTWKYYADAYTVPSGQGTTVFGWIDISAHDGNIIDNVVFASGSDPDPEPEATYAGDNSISAKTKAGYAYALAEVRGSSVIELGQLTASYNGTPIEPTANLGTSGWYSKVAPAGSGFADGGEIVFSGLVPGKTYRLIGIPILAINPDLGVNESPGAVLDDGYYSDIKLTPGAAASSDSMPAYDAEIYNDGGEKKVRLKLANANANAEFALLSESDGLPVTGTPFADWTVPEGGALAFEGLAPVTTYYLIARPRGYTEIDYAEAVRGGGKGGAEGLNALEIKTPPADTEEISENDVSRALNETEITLKGTGTAAGQTYALTDPFTGEIIASKAYANGNDISFLDLDAGKTYRLVTSADGKNWLTGVRVYPYANMSPGIDYADAAIGTGDDLKDPIPSGVEYRVASVGVDLVGSAEEWISSWGVERLELDDDTLVSADALEDGSPAMSVLDALDASGATGPTAGEFIYRVSADTGYDGPSVRPARSLLFPARPAAPAATAFDIDCENEKIVAIGSGLEWVQSHSNEWLPLTQEGVAFEDAGWQEVSDCNVNIRTEADAASSKFASSAATAVVPQRPPAPSGLRARLADPNDQSKGIDIYMLEIGTSYQYRAGSDGDWETFLAEGGDDQTDLGIINLPYSDQLDYDIRLASDGDFPASFYATVSSPLNISAVNFPAYVYGSPIAPAAITINNIVGNPVTVSPGAVTLTGDGSELFEIIGPTEETEIGANSSESSEWRIAPKSDSEIGAGIYRFKINLEYTYGDGENARTYTATGSVYLSVSKAEWAMDGVTGTISGVTATGFSVAIQGAPSGATLEYSYAGGAWQTQTSFMNLSPHNVYNVRVRAKADANYNISRNIGIGTAYTAFATPVQGDIVIDYRAETIAFNGVAFDVLANGTAIANGASLSELAEGTSISFRVTRKAENPYPASTTFEIAIPGKDNAPASDSVTSTPSSDDKTSDGKILRSGPFEYRVSRNGANPTAGWYPANGEASVAAGRYEVRFAPSDNKFASKMTQITVLSAKPQVTLDAKTVPGDPETKPNFIMIPSVWDPSTDPDRDGQYDREYTATPMPLPSLNEVTSRSHVFLGWYGAASNGTQNGVYDPSTGEFTGTPVTHTPTETDKSAKYYYAKWAVRPIVSSVNTESGTVAPEIDTDTASAGLTPSAPAILNIRLANGDNQFALSDISFAGQHADNAPKL
ncbi:MAG: hypothetical protein LBH63_00950, partial [Clostridiales Family XIII bacterium]|nr:hypothetical protein [Clostridiales Family XIII bacterium]